MRRAIFGLGAAQLALTAAVLAGIGVATGLVGWRGAIVAGLGLAMSATAIALKILEDRGDLQQSYGQRAFAILLFQDMSVVPLLALLPLLAPGGESHASFADALLSVGQDRGRDRRRRGRRPLAAQSVPAAARRHRRARGDDRGRAAGRARRRRADAGGRHVDGARRVPRRHDARRIELPPRARGRHRAVPRPAARAVLHGRRHVDRRRGGARQLGADRRGGAGDLGAQDRGGVAPVPADLRHLPRRAARRRRAHRGGRVRLRARFRSASRSARSAPRRAACSRRSPPSPC